MIMVHEKSAYCTHTHRKVISLSLLSLAFFVFVEFDCRLSANRRMGNLHFGFGLWIVVDHPRDQAGQ
jgi:hypothetical protein